MPLPASFAEFHGNHAVVDNLRAAIASGRLPHSLILAGPRGAGKYTLALLLAMALQCGRQPRERSAQDETSTPGEPGRAAPAGRPLAGFCGVCRHCVRIAASAELEQRVEEAVAAREDMREADKKDTRVLVQTHPDVLVIPPDPPQLLIKLGQVRTLIARAQYLPSEAPARVFLLTSAAFMKEAENSLLKTLEEPPAHVYLILLAENVSELLPTVRSRCSVARLGALPVAEIERLLAERRPELPAAERSLAAHLSEGAVGRALSFNAADFLAARADALVILRSALGRLDHSTLFRMTETYRAGAEGQLKTTALLRALGGLLEDLLLVSGGAADRVRNFDLRRELGPLAESFSFAALESALRALDAVQSGLRRNLLRGLSLDALAAELEETLAG